MEFGPGILFTWPVCRIWPHAGHFATCDRESDGVLVWLPSGWCAICDPYALIVSHPVLGEVSRPVQMSGANCISLVTLA